jgi:hypothetical protein
VVSENGPATPNYETNFVLGNETDDLTSSEPPDLILRL